MCMTSFINHINIFRGSGTNARDGLKNFTPRFSKIPDFSGILSLKKDNRIKNILDFILNNDY